MEEFEYKAKMKGDLELGLYNRMSRKKLRVL